MRKVQEKNLQAQLEITKRHTNPTPIAFTSCTFILLPPVLESRSMGGKYRSIEGRSHKLKIKFAPVG